MPASTFLTHQDKEPAFDCCFFEPMWKADSFKANDGQWIPGVHATPVRLTWRALVSGLTRFREVPSKAECPGWMPVHLSEPYRKKENVVSVSCLVLDIDSGMDICAAGDAFQDWPHIIHTSYSSTEGHHKARLVVPLEEPCPVKWFPRLWRWGQSRLGDMADEQTKDASRFFYLPAAGPGGHNVAIVNDEASRFLDPRPWSSLPITPEEVAAEDAQRKREDYERRRSEGKVPNNQARGEELKHSAGARLALGLALGGRQVGGKIKGVVCPACGRKSVWWPLEPYGTPQGMCEHMNSCGWTGWLDLLEGVR